MSNSQPDFFSVRFQTALQCAEAWHTGQLRKGTAIPYLSHLLGVASLALEFGADEDEAIAALLHDALEDGPDYAHPPRTPEFLRSEMVRLFGEQVAKLVDAATDDAPQPGQPKKAWAVRKQRYLQHLSSAAPAELLISASDKLYNARSIVVDVLNAPAGVDIFERFKQKRDGTLQYYRLLADTYQVATQRPDVSARPRLAALFNELERTVSTLEQICGVTPEEVRGYPLLSLTLQT